MFFLLSSFNIFANKQQSTCLRPPSDGKSLPMAMATSNPCGDITDMECSPAELEEFTKEVWLRRSSNYLKT